MNAKKTSRIRRAQSARFKIRELGATRLCVNRTPQHMYAQITNSNGSVVLAAASTLDKEIRDGSTGNVEAAKKVGQLIAERAKSAGITKVAFDRSGFKYHGRVKALADAARDSGLDF